MKSLYSAALCCLVLPLSHQAGAIPVGSCAALASPVRLATFEDPLGVEQVNSIDNSCVAVGWAEGIDEADYAAIWPATGFYLDSAGVATEVPVLLDSPWDFANSDTSALDIYGSLVLFQYTMSVSPAIPCCYAVYDLATNTWSAPMTSDASWTHTPQLTNASGWSVEYGTNYYGHENAFLVSTPEPDTGTLCSTGVVTLLLFGLLANRRLWRALHA
jgi:hypothetical protein